MRFSKRRGFDYVRFVGSLGGIGMGLMFSFRLERFGSFYSFLRFFSCSLFGFLFRDRKFDYFRGFELF